MCVLKLSGTQNKILPICETLNNCSINDTLTYSKHLTVDMA